MWVETTGHTELQYHRVREALEEMQKVIWGLKVGGMEKQPE